jgi:hypothetical protein
VTQKGRYPKDALCLAQRKGEDGPCQNLRNTCTRHCGGDRSDGGRCARRPDGPSLRCARHGGRSPKGRAHPNYRHGGESKYAIPEGILERYQRHLEDPELTHHRSLIALYDALIDNIFDEWEKIPSLEQWEVLKSQVEKLRRARDSGDTVRLLEAISDIEDLVKKGASKAAKRKELREIGEARRRAASDETKRKLIESQTYTEEQVAMFGEQVAMLVRKYLPRELLIDFYNDYARLIGSREINLDDPDGGDFLDGGNDRRSLPGGSAAE